MDSAGSTDTPLPEPATLLEAIRYYSDLDIATKDKWLPAMWMIANDRNGVSSWQLHRALGVTQKTAWFMLQRLRLAIQTGTFEKAVGRVEVDETFIGGKARNMHKHIRAKRSAHIPHSLHFRGAVAAQFVTSDIEEAGP